MIFIAFLKIRWGRLTPVGSCSSATGDAVPAPDVVGLHPEAGGARAAARRRGGGHHHLQAWGGVNVNHQQQHEQRHECVAAGEEPELHGDCSASSWQGSRRRYTIQI